jgi:glycosidase
MNYKRLSRIMAALILFSVMTGCTKKEPDMTKIPVPKEDTTPIKKEIEKQYNVFYQIYPRSFRDSNGDGIGDIKGIIQALDYLNDGDPNTNTDLGVTGLWITPLTPAPTDHKYNTTDYYNIAPEYGTIDDYKELLEEAHKRGIKVTMDFVVNHVSAYHKWFQEAAKDPKSPYRDYFRWIKSDTAGYDINANPWNQRKVWVKKGDYYVYGLFEDIVLDLNYENPKVREEVKKIAKFWIDMGVDGFRLDTANNIYGPSEYPKGTDTVKNNIAWWTEFSKYVRGIKPDFYLFGEVWDKADVIAPYLKPFDGLWNFTIQDMIPNMVNSGLDVDFASKLDKQYKIYEATTKDYIDLPFLTNHDQDRIMGRLRNDPVRAKLAANIYLTLPGSPFIYAGEELGMTTGNMRTPIKWFDESKAPQTKWTPIKNSNQIVSWEKQKDDINSLYNHYKKIVRVRTGNEALVKGNFEPVNTGTKRIAAYKRNLIKDATITKSVLVIHNLDFEEVSVKLSEIDVNGMKVYFDSSDSIKGTINGSEFKMAPQSTVILEK